MAKSKKKPAVKKAVKKAAKKSAKAPAKKAAPKKTPVKKTAAKKSVAKKSVAKKAPVKKASAPAKLKAAQPFSSNKPSKKIDLSGFVTPLDDRVMIQVSEAPKKTAGGLYIPDNVTSVTGNLEGLVVSVGRGRLDKKGKVHAMDLKVGDKVMFTEHSASKIKIQDHELMILRESDVLGVVG